MAHGGGGSERWLLTYSDLITLLMVFFVVMYSISEADKSKYLLLKSSLQRAFNGEVEARPSILTKDGGAALLDAPKPAPETVGIEQQNPGNHAIAPLTSDGTTSDQQDQQKVDALRNAVIPLAESQGVSDNVTVFQGEEGLVVSISGNLLFDSGKAELKPDGALFLNAVADTIRNWPNRVRVEGNTDNVPINTAVYPSNWELSAARSVVVTRYLTEQEKIDPRRVGATAYGQFQAIADNDDREGRSRNRRVDILILGVGNGTNLQEQAQP